MVAYALYVYLKFELSQLKVALSTCRFCPTTELKEAGVEHNSKKDLVKSRRDKELELHETRVKAHNGIPAKESSRSLNMLRFTVPKPKRLHPTA